MEYLVHFNALFWALQWNVQGNFDRIFDALQWNIWCNSMRCFGHFNGMFWALQCNFLGTSMECIKRLNGIFGALRYNIWRTSMETFVFASPVYSNKLQVCKMSTVLSIALYRRDNRSIRLREEHTGLQDRNLPGGLKQNAKKETKCWNDNLQMAMWQGLASTHRQTRKLISGPSPASRLLSFNPLALELDI